MVLNSLKFCLSGKLLISPSTLNKSFAGKIFFVVGSSLLSLQIYCAIWFWLVVSFEQPADNLMGVTLYVITCLSLVAFNILSLSLIFVNLFTVCLSVFLLGFILSGTLCFLDLVNYFLSHVRELVSYYLFKYFLRSFLSLFSF